jgi:glycosyltransferase involved in cell wall biosynthesis
MRILQIHNVYRQRGGEEAVVASEAELLRGHGHDVVQYQVANPDSNLKGAVKLLAAPWNPASARRVHSVARESGADLAHVHNTWFSLSPSIFKALRDAGLPVVATLHNFRATCANGLLLRDDRPCDLCVGASTLPAIRYRCFRGSAGASALSAATISLNRKLGTWNRYVDRVVVLSHFAKEYLARSGIQEEHMDVYDGYAPDPGPRTRPADQSDLLLYAGRLSTEKGVETLAEAWGRYGGGLRLDIAGDGPMRHLLDGKPGVRLLGRVPPEQVASLMLEARALVVPSICFEGRPRAMLEAFAAGLPVVASNLGGMKEMLDPISPETIVPAGDAAAWSTAFRTLENQSLHDLSAAMRATYESSFGPNAAVANLTAIYERAITAARSA